MTNKYTIHELAEISGVTVRTLHHYDEIGLLKPQRSSSNGYRIYSQDNLLRLQQILILRELDVPLAQISKLLSSDNLDYLPMLREHKKVMKNNRDRIDKIITSIDKTISKLEKGDVMADSDMYGGLTKKQYEEYSKEAQERWGDTKAYKESVVNVKKMGKEGLAKVSAETKRIELELSKLMDKDVSDSRVQKLVAAHRSNISKFYSVSDEMYRGLAEMYISDPRFTAHYDHVKPGLADFLSRAIVASL